MSIVSNLGSRIVLGVKRLASRVRALTLSPLSSNGFGWWPAIREATAGNWQTNVEVDSPRNLLAFSAVYACVTIIATDVAKMRIKLMVENESSGVAEEQRRSPLLEVLRKPNHYQNRIKFIESWVLSKLLNGNTYVLKQRDRRRVVRKLYVLDPNRVTPLVAETGDVYYRISRDDLAQVPENTIVLPASEIIHDTMVTLWHPLIGVTPLFACGVSATLGNKIQAGSTTLFSNASRPSGILTAPGAISPETAATLKAQMEANFRGENIGRLAVFGDGLKYEMISMKAEDAQLIQQLKWTVEDVARAFHMPLYKIGGPPPSYNNIEALQQAYYSDCLQAIIESLELSLDEGLELPERYGTELDLDNLMRMDSFSLYERNNKAVAGGWLAPDEARAKAGYQPVPGGASPYMQQQNWTLAQLSDRKAPEDKPSVSPPPSQSEDDDDELDVAAIAERFGTRLEECDARV